MTFRLRDRVKETSTTTGTGTYTLLGAVAGFQAFSAIGDGNTTWYCATDGTDWEVGVGTYTLAGTTLARTTVLASSNAGAAVNWAAGTRTIFCDIPATAGGGETLLATVTPSVTATLNVTGLPVGYNAFRIEGNTISVGSGSGVSLLMNISSDNGSTFDTAAAVGVTSTGTNMDFMGLLSCVGVTGTKLFSGIDAHPALAVNNQRFGTKTSPTNALRFTWSGGQNFTATGSIRIFGTASGN